MALPFFYFDGNVDACVDQCPDETFIRRGGLNFLIKTTHDVLRDRTLSGIPVTNTSVGNPLVISMTRSRELFEWMGLFVLLIYEKYNKVEASQAQNIMEEDRRTAKSKKLKEDYNSAKANILKYLKDTALQGPVSAETAPKRILYKPLSPRATCALTVNANTLKKFQADSFPGLLRLKQDNSDIVSFEAEVALNFSLSKGPLDKFHLLSLTSSGSSIDVVQTCREFYKGFVYNEKNTEDFKSYNTSVPEWLRAKATKVQSESMEEQPKAGEILKNLNLLKDFPRQENETLDDVKIIVLGMSAKKDKNLALGDTPAVQFMSNRKDYPLLITEDLGEMLDFENLTLVCPSQDKPMKYSEKQYSIREANGDVLWMSLFKALQKQVKLDQAPMDVDGGNAEGSDEASAFDDSLLKIIRKYLKFKQRQAGGKLSCLLMLPDLSYDDDFAQFFGRHMQKALKMRSDTRKQTCPRFFAFTLKSNESKVVCVLATDDKDCTGNVVVQKIARASDSALATFLGNYKGKKWNFQTLFGVKENTPTLKLDPGCIADFSGVLEDISNTVSYASYTTTLDLYEHELITLPSKESKRMINLNSDRSFWIEFLKHSLLGCFFNENGDVTPLSFLPQVGELTADQLRETEAYFNSVLDQDFFSKFQSTSNTLPDFYADVFRDKKWKKKPDSSVTAKTLMQMLSNSKSQIKYPLSSIPKIYKQLRKMQDKKKDYTSAKLARNFTTYAFTYQPTSGAPGDNCKRGFVCHNFLGPSQDNNTRFNFSYYLCIGDMGVCFVGSPAENTWVPSKRANQIAFEPCAEKASVEVTETNKERLKRILAQTSDTSDDEESDASTSEDDEESDMDADPEVFDTKEGAERSPGSGNEGEDQGEKTIPFFELMGPFQKPVALNENMSCYATSIMVALYALGVKPAENFIYDPQKRAAFQKLVFQVPLLQSAMRGNWSSQMDPQEVLLQMTSEAFSDSLESLSASQDIKRELLVILTKCSELFGANQEGFLKQSKKYMCQFNGGNTEELDAEKKDEPLLLWNVEGFGNVKNLIQEPFVENIKTFPIPNYKTIQEWREECWDPPTEGGRELISDECKIWKGEYNAWERDQKENDPKIVLMRKDVCQDEKNSKEVKTIQKITEHYYDHPKGGLQDNSCFCAFFNPLEMDNKGNSKAVPGYMLENGQEVTVKVKNSDGTMTAKKALLVAVLFKRGSARSGHYAAKIRCNNGKVYLVDDERPDKTSDDRGATMLETKYDNGFFPYLLFYKFEKP